MAKKNFGGLNSLGDRVSPTRPQAFVVKNKPPKVKRREPARKVTGITGKKQEVPPPPPENKTEGEKQKEKSDS